MLFRDPIEALTSTLFWPTKRMTNSVVIIVWDILVLPGRNSFLRNSGMVDDLLQHELLRSKPVAATWECGKWQQPVPTFSRRPCLCCARRATGASTRTACPRRQTVLTSVRTPPSRSFSGNESLIGILNAALLLFVTN